MQNSLIYPKDFKLLLGVNYAKPWTYEIIGNQGKRTQPPGNNLKGDRLNEVQGKSAIDYPTQSPIKSGISFNNQG